MKITIWKGIVTAAFVIMIMATAQVSVSAQEMGKGGSKILEGVWDFQVTRLNCETGETIGVVPAMLTYVSGGTLIDWGTGNSPSRRSVGQGVWSHTSGRSFVAAFQFFRFNVDGTLAGKQIGRQQIEVSRDGNSLNAVGSAQLIDINGNVTANNCSTATATRFE